MPSRSFTIIEKLDETNSAVIYRARLDGDTDTVVIKQLLSEHPTASELARFRQEYERIKSLDMDGVIKVIDILHSESAVSLVLEDFQGIGLHRHQAQRRLDVKGVLEIAIKLASTLGYLHKHNVIHKDIKPHNVLINPHTAQVKLTDFGISAVLPKGASSVARQGMIEGTLPYMSPEQTGRINRSVDYRTDLYSFGVMLYEMATGQLPFRAQDPMELIHAHIAKVAVSPSQIDPTVPQALSDIVLKLMAKNPDDRYQNSFGVLADLEECAHQLADTGTIAPFVLAQNDISLRFNLPQRLLGREQELAIFRDAFDRLCKAPNGRLGIHGELLVVTGQPGIGKSMLVNQLQLPIVAQRGFFIAGKYDQFRRDVPYSAIIQALMGLMRPILREGDLSIQYWKTQLQHALASNGKVITDVIPELELIIGKQAELPVLGPEEAQNRFHFVFRNFIQCFAQETHPLVLFLDDLQWADIASLHLMHSMISDSAVRHALFIVAYRDNEATPEQAFVQTLHAIKKDGVHVNNVHVQALAPDSVNQLIASFLRCAPDQSHELAQIVHDKTQGNPFFVNLFLKNLYDENIIELDPKRGWVWDIARLSTLQVTDNVVEMMAVKISELPVSTRDLLMVCACIGNRFDLETLAYAYQQDIETTLLAVASGIDEGLVCLTEDIYRFYHDRIQAAAYSLLDADSKARIHRRIGQYGLRNTSAFELPTKILYIVDQLNAGRNDILDADEQVQLAGLNLMAGRKATQSAAYESALKYYRVGMALLPDGAWTAHYTLCLSLHVDAAQAAYLSAQFELATSLSQSIATHGVTLLDRLKADEIRMQILAAQNQMYESLMLGVDVIARLGVTLPKRPHLGHILSAVLKTRWALRGASEANLLAAARMNDAQMQVLMRLCAHMGVMSAWTVRELLPLLFSTIVNKSIQYGNAPQTPFALAAIAAIEVSLGRVERAYQLGTLALKLADQLDARAQQPRVRFTMDVYIRPERESAHICMPHLVSIGQQAQEVGDTEFQAHAAMIYSMLAVYTGVELSEFEQELTATIAAVAKLKQQSQLNILKMVHQVVLNLRSSEGASFVLAGASYDEEPMLAHHEKTNDALAIFFCYAFKAQLAYMDGHYATSIHFAQQARIANQQLIQAGTTFPIHNFYPKNGS
jgi:predicted ATPase